MTLSRDNGAVTSPEQAKALADEIRDEIRQGFERFYHLGMKLKRWRATEAWKQLGYKSFGESIRPEFDFTARHACNTIAAAEIRPDLPEVGTTGSQTSVNVWTERSVRELLRLETKSDQKRVAGKVKTWLGHNPKERFSAALVKKFVDADKGPPPKKKIRPPKQGEGNVQYFLETYARDIETWMERLQVVDQGGWKLLRENEPQAISDLIKACESLATFMRKVAGHVHS
jgi:hypothetical protein